MDNFDLSKINELIDAEYHFINQINDSIHKIIIGQDNLIETLLLAILSDGHIFLEGVPGLAKTLTIKSLAQIIDTKFQRLQFTPDLLPADIIGTLIFNPKESIFEVKKGPLFANIILADEINRSPAKVQSALLEAMQERQITIGDSTFQLENPFLVMATQNPIEQEGTYPLPEAQIDRFMFKVNVNYPTKEEEIKILRTMDKIDSNIQLEPIVKTSQILSARKIVNKIHMADNIQEYIVSLVFATRKPENYGLNDLGSLITYGASPRATIFLSKAAKSHAFLKKRGFVIPEDVRAVGESILRHRIILSYEAEAEDITTDNIINRIYESVPTP